MKEGIKVTARFVVTAKLSENKVAVLDLKTFEERYYPIKKLYRSTRISSPKDVLWLVAKDAEKESVCSSRALFNAVCKYYFETVGKRVTRMLLTGASVLLVIRAVNGNVYGVSPDESFDCLHKGRAGANDDELSLQKSPCVFSMRVSASGVAVAPTFIRSTVFDVVLPRYDTSENLPYVPFFLDLGISRECLGEFTCTTSYDPTWRGNILTIKSALCLLTEMRALMQGVIGEYADSIVTVVIDLNFASSIRMSHEINWRGAFAGLSMFKVSFTPRSRCNAKSLYAMFDVCKNLQVVDLGCVDAVGYTRSEGTVPAPADYFAAHPVFRMFNLAPSLREVKLGHIQISSLEDLEKMFDYQKTGVPDMYWTPKVSNGVSEDAVVQWLHKYRKEGI